MRSRFGANISALRIPDAIIATGRSAFGVTPYSAKTTPKSALPASIGANQPIRSARRPAG